MSKLGVLSGAIWRRQHIGLNSIFLWLGARGIGKSYGCLKVGEVFDRNFNVDRVVFNLESFLESLESIKKPYSWLVFDELGLEIPAREWLSTANKIMSYISQSFRFTKINLSIATPNPSYVDVHIRELSDFWVVMQTRGVGRVYKVIHNPFAKPSRSLKTPYLCNIELGLPSDRLQRAYEDKRREVLSSKYAEYLSQTQYQREKEAKKGRNFNLEALDMIDTLYDDKGKLSAYIISSKLGIGLTKAYQVLHYLESEVG
jgi:hypothetical protein